MSNKHVSHKHGGKSNPRLRPKSTHGKRRNKANARVKSKALRESNEIKKRVALKEIE
ncbi:MAG: hypothetical protein US92_C0010G0022 [Candidatus Peregrinibacteria bacterium GW2011_GWA2_38_36]|nr:MAG: hypothetical protein US92_C0010G0022 [Candidatus Peregrinibacteria bacterium GW2011_GWA2_38_36]